MHKAQDTQLASVNTKCTLSTTIGYAIIIAQKKVIYKCFDRNKPVSVLLQ